MHVKQYFFLLYMGGRGIVSVLILGETEVSMN